MGLYRDHNDVVVEMDDAQARMQGFTPVSAEEQHAQATSEAMRARGEERGWEGELNAALTGAASSVTLGGTDYLLGELLSDDQRQRANAEIEANPGFRAAGEIGGALLGAMATGGSSLAKTPAGYLSSYAGQAVEHGVAQGGIAGTAKALGAMGAEGAFQNAGQYIGRAALADTETSAEGFGAAVGTGFAFGAGAGGASLGVIKGTIAARRLYSKLFDGSQEALVDASTAWERQSQTLLEADADNATKAKQILDDISSAKRSAAAEVRRTDIRLREEQARAADIATLPPRPAFSPEGTVPMGEKYGPSELYGPTEAPREQFGPFEFQGPRERPPLSGESTQVIPREQLEKGGKASSAPDVRAKPTTGEPTQVIPRDQLMREPQLRESDIPAEALASSRFATFGEELPWERSFRETAETLGDDIAKQEADLTEALKEFEDARQNFLDNIADDAARKIKPPVPYDFAMRSDMIDTPQGVGGARRAAPEDATRAGTPNKKRVVELELSHEDAIARGDTVLAADLEAQLAKLTPDDVVSDVGRAANAITRYEKASAKLTEALGDLAHPASIAAADEIAKAETDAMRKYTDRSARAMEDAETFGPWQEYGPQEIPTKERLAYAKSDKANARAEYAKIAAQEADAKAAYNKANAQHKLRLKETKAQTKAAQAESKVAGKVGKAADFGSVLEILDVPGLPKPSDLPVVGPLLGAYLKFRGVKAAMSRFSGRVPATAENRMAALSAQTKDRIAKAIDRSLTITEKVGKAGMKSASLAGVMSSRLYDDGEPDAEKNAPLHELVAVRTRELAAYVNTPGAIERDVRKQLAGVTDPDLISAVEKWRRGAMEYLLENAPKFPPQSPLVKQKVLPSPAVATDFARRYEAVNDPASIYERIESEQAMITLQAAETLRRVYPQLFALSQQRLMEQAQRIQNTVPQRQRVQMSLLYDIPLDPSMDPDNMKILQQSFVRKPAPVPAVQGSTPTPSVAASVDLTAMFQPSADRRAQR